ncbi:hypothetical protein SAMN05661044_05451 [Olivibacter domesticus]|uniref:Uncharacterized protein n=1 Tax=Olivibacter domesticus TaxID=407022 RepID=A0A1H7Z6Z2_OLID1|nr:hypothetical protein SAMN05661044_05451 [Olivibacter domesticus]
MVVATDMDIVNDMMTTTIVDTIEIEIITDMTGVITGMSEIITRNAINIITSKRNIITGATGMNITDILNGPVRIATVQDNMFISATIARFMIHTEGATYTGQAIAGYFRATCQLS